MVYKPKMFFDKIDQDRKELLCKNQKCQCDIGFWIWVAYEF